MLFIEYPKCSTCQRAKCFLLENNISFNDRNIVVDNPNESELKEFLLKSKQDINKFFNTSGLKYRSLDLKNKLVNMTESKKIKLLATDGMLVKRPLLILDNDVLIGFKEKIWIEKLLCDKK